MTYKVFLSAGIYTFKLIHHTDEAKGILKIQIDGSTVLTRDCYSVGAVYNVVTTQTNIAVNTSGVKDIKFIVDGKNVAATFYDFVVNFLQMYRTA